MRQKPGSEKAPAEQVVKDIRRATRRQFTAEEKIRIVLRLFRDLKPVQAEAVSARALEIGAFAYRAVAAIASRQAAARTAAQ